MVEGVVWASGLAKRFGKNKLFMPLWDQGARQIIEKYPHRVIKVFIQGDIENYAIDTREDYQKAVEHLTNRQYSP